MPEARPETEFDAIIVGAGFAGLYMLHRLRGLGLSALVLEAGDGVGGTWYWNRYPGARCDVESMQYSYQFDDDLQQEWEWQERYAPQPEILRYANHVADRFDLRRDIRFGTRVTAATWQEGSGRWEVETEAGERFEAQHCIMATGCLSAANLPAFDGLETFRGARYHTGNWPHEPVDFTGLKVGVIGTGSSAIQSVPLIAAEAEQLTVFQRTANYAVPAHNQPLDPATVAQVKANYPALRAKARSMVAQIAFDPNDVSALAVDEGERHQQYEKRWAYGGLTFMGSFNDLLLDKQANDTAADFVRGKIHDIVDDPDTAALLSPTNIIGCKRLCVDTDYYATYNRDNVALVDVGETPIGAITETGVRVGDEEYGPFDALVFATGFDAMTGAILRVDIKGRGGESLREKWAAGPRTYLGLATSGFPNLFTITGPGSPSVLTNMLPSIEHHVEWIADCIAHLRDRGHREIDARREAEDAWVGHVNQVADMTLRSTCSSWYLGANVPGKPRVFMPYVGGFPAYAQKCESVVENGYEGFELRG